MKKVKLFAVKKKMMIEGSEAEPYFKFYLVLSKEYIFTFLIESPNLACSDRHPIRLIKYWLMEFEHEYVKYLRRYERATTALSKLYNKGKREYLYHDAGMNCKVYQCLTCGHTLKEDDNFCSHCGADVRDDKANDQGDSVEM